MKFQLKYLLALIPLVAVIALIYFFRQIVGYVIIAWVMSMIGAPLVLFLRKYIGKTAAAIATLSVYGLVFVLMLYIFIPPLVNQVRQLSRIDFEQVVQTIEEPIKDWENWLIDKGLIVDSVKGEPTVLPPSAHEFVYQQDYFLDSLYQLKDSSLHSNVSINLRIDASELLAVRELEKQQTEDVDFFTKLKNAIVYYINPTRIQGIFTTTFSAFGNILVGVASVFFIAFFFLKEQGLFFEMVKAAVPQEYEEQTRHAIRDISNLLIRYFTGILLQISVITIFVSVTLTLLGIKNGLLIGFFAGLMNVIPYIGPILGAVFGVIITLSSGTDASFYDDVVPQLIKVVAVFGVMQMLDNFILQPNIFSKSVKAHPLEIFLIVLIGAKVGGVLGMILAIPVYTALRVVAKVFLSEFKVVKAITRNL